MQLAGCIQAQSSRLQWGAPRQAGFSLKGPAQSRGTCLNQRAVRCAIRRKSSGEQPQEVHSLRAVEDAIIALRLQAVKKGAPKDISLDLRGNTYAQSLPDGPTPSFVIVDDGMCLSNGTLIISSGDIGFGSSFGGSSIGGSSFGGSPFGGSSYSGSSFTHSSVDVEARDVKFKDLLIRTDCNDSPFSFLSSLVKVRKGGSLTMENCVVQGGDMSVSVSGMGSSLTASDSHFVSKEGYGLEVDFGGEALLTSCTLDGCGQSGARVSSCNATLEAHHCSISKNADSNVDVGYEGFADLYRCTISKSRRGHGVLLRDGGAHISACEVDGNFASNLHVEDASVTVQGGTFRYSKSREGLLVKGSKAELLASNIKAWGNKEMDLVSEKGASVELSECTVPTMSMSGSVTLSN